MLMQGGALQRPSRVSESGRLGTMLEGVEQIMIQHEKEGLIRPLDWNRESPETLLQIVASVVVSYRRILNLRDIQLLGVISYRAVTATSWTSNKPCLRGAFSNFERHVPRKFPASSHHCKLKPSALEYLSSFPNMFTLRNWHAPLPVNAQAALDEPAPHSCHSAAPGWVVPAVQNACGARFAGFSVDRLSLEFAPFQIAEIVAIGRRTEASERASAD